ncbi:glutamate--tRNA ligase [Methanogenium organophilum]|uniref:Glutamate--tRNA ligase n=1 Tax=Methanogenium organophilum TaxID=2199 RepID=A0A9X9S3J8_METOG|nr:glutamate--tRNA ligase [Methanogenium organophilum]WAI01264.1 glutamate--tRNA ligase [Methanogenium organophilum]
MNGDSRDFLYKYALQNAVMHNNVPKAGAVLGALMGKHPELRPHAREYSALLGEILAEIGEMNSDERRTRLEELAPELLEKKEKKKRETGLRPLENVGEEGVVMRFAPNPSGPLHLGHSRAAYLNDYYIRKYGGKYILRIEDTDPKRVTEENYQLLLSDVEWLGIEVSDIVYQSDRMDIYYSYGEKLISMGGAYLCTCDSELFRELKNSKQECPCRNRGVEENLSLWKDMLAGKFEEGQITVRVKTNISHPDPAMRDFSIFRIVANPPHPRCDGLVYPLMNFSVAVDDHLLGMTHVIRGKDHIANTRRQKYIYDYFGWEQPTYFHYGRMSIGDIVLSTSAMKAGIASGEYTGWDDIHLGTLKAIARRGFSPEAVRNAMVDIGIGQTDINFSWDNLYAANKAIVDPIANRYFFVPNPELCHISGVSDRIATPLINPNDEAKGTRTLTFTGDIFLPRDELVDGRMLRLKDLFNVRVTKSDDGFSLEYSGDSLDEARTEHAQIVQWLPKDMAMPCMLHTPDGIIAGVCEPDVSTELNRVVQFERVGFARIDSVSETNVSAYFAHK